MTVLDGFRVVQVGRGLAAAVCGRMLADVGAEVSRIDPDRSTPLADYLNHDASATGGLEAADLIVCEGSPATLRRAGHDAGTLRRHNPAGAIVLISPFGQTGPRAEEPATDLTLFFASGIARMLTGQVDDLDEAPLCPVGRQSAFIGGLTAACAGMHAALAGNGTVVDVSIHEALATLAMTELARAGQTGKSWSRQRVDDGNGATVCILPASDGYVAISPREDRQWASWLAAMGSPAWGLEPRFATKQDRVANWDPLHALMAAWSRDKPKLWIAETAQAAHVPSFPLCEPAEHLGSRQLRHRAFFQTLLMAGQTVQAPRSPFGLQFHVRAGVPEAGVPNAGVQDAGVPEAGVPEAEVPDAGVPEAEVPDARVPDAGVPDADARDAGVPEAGAPDAGANLGSAAAGRHRASAARVLSSMAGSSAASAVPSDENRGQDTCSVAAADAPSLPLSGVRVLDFSWVIAGPTATRYLAAMGAEVIKIEAPGRGDPGRASELHSVLGQAKRSVVLDLKKPAAVAVARALAAKADVVVENFATGVMDRLGLGAEALRAVAPDLIYVSASGLGRSGPEAHAVAYGTLLQCYAGFGGLNRHPKVAPRVGMAWLDPMCGLMLAFITAAAVWRRRRGVVARVDFSMLEAMLWTMAEPLLSEQGAQLGGSDTGAVFRCSGPDDWLAVDPAPASPPPFPSADCDATHFAQAGTAAAVLARSADLVSCPHLRARGFWDASGTGVLPGLPWRASCGRRSGPAPALGGDTQAVLREVLGMSAAEIAALSEAGVVG